MREGTEGEEREGNGREVQGERREERRGRGRDIPVPDWESEKVATLWHRHRPHCLPEVIRTITTVKRNLNDKLQVSNGEIHFIRECVNLVRHTNFTAICVTEADF